MSEKLQKVLARAGAGSRREMETYISAGRVSVEGKTAYLGDRVEGNELIRVDGHQIKLKPLTDDLCRVLMYNKPEGEMCTRKERRKERWKKKSKSKPKKKTYLPEWK